MTSKLLLIAGLGIGYYLFVKIPHKEVKYLPEKFARKKVTTGIPKKTLSISTVINQPIITPIEVKSVTIVELEEEKRQIRIDTVEAINRHQAVEKAKVVEITRVAAIKSTGIIPRTVTTNLASLEAELAREKAKLTVATGGTWMALKRLVNDLNRRIKVAKRGY